MSERRGAVARLAAWSVRHRAVVLGAWVVALVVAMAASHAAHPRYVNNVSLPGTDSQRATDLLRHDFAAQSGDLDQIVLHVRSGSIRGADVRARVAPALAQVARLPHVARVVSPFAPGGGQAVSRDGRTAFATVAFDERADALPKAAIDPAIAVARAARSPGPQVELGGQAIQQAHRPSLGAATAIGLLAAIVVLLITFGSAMAMGLPIVTALLGLGTALGLVGLGSRLIDTPDFATQLGALLGLGVGIDYALFIVTRFREALRAGDDAEGAIGVAMDTAGRAVLFAGVTVIVALLGLFVLGIGLLAAAGVVARLPHDGRGPAALTAVGAALRRTPGVASVSGPVVGPHGSTAVYEAFPRSSPQSRATTDLVDRLRHRELPPLASRTGTRLLVGGSTATGIDFSHVLARRLPLFIGLVVALGGLLLLLAFRSIAIPIQAAAMNLLSVAASLGVVTAVFQHGWLGSLVGVRAGPIEPFIPVILFAIAFGLSMDYEVFLVSRIHEARRGHGDSRRALIEGVGSTARVVTAAATIMVCVFASFVLGDMRVVKLFGLGLASAVFLDAFVVRSLLLPSVLALAGDRAWSLPARLDRRLPRLDVDAQPAEA